MISLARKYHGLASYRRTYQRDGETWWANDLVGSYFHEIRKDNCVAFWPCGQQNAAASPSGVNLIENRPGTMSTGSEVEYTYIDCPVVDDGRDSESIYHSQADIGPDAGLVTNAPFLTLTNSLGSNVDTYFKGPDYFIEGLNTKDMVGGITTYPYSLEGWMKPTGSPFTGEHWFIAWQDTEGGTDDYIAVAASWSSYMTPTEGPWKVLVCSGGTETEYETPSCTAPWYTWPWHDLSDEWNHVVLTATSTGFVLYVNGRVMMDRTVTMPTFPTRGYRFMGGASLDESGASDDVQEKCNAHVWGFAVYDVALSHEQVARHYMAATRCYDLQLERGTDGNGVAVTISSDKYRSVGEQQANCVVWPVQDRTQSDFFGLTTPRQPASAPIRPSNGIMHELAYKYGGYGIVMDARLGDLPATIIDFFKTSTSGWVGVGNDCGSLSLPADNGLHLWLDADGGTTTIAPYTGYDELLPRTDGGINLHHAEATGTDTDDHINTRTHAGNPHEIRTWPVDMPGKRNKYLTLAHSNNWSGLNVHENTSVNQTTLQVQRKTIVEDIVGIGESNKVSNWHTRDNGDGGHVEDASCGCFNLGNGNGTGGGHLLRADSGSGADFYPGCWPFAGRMGPTTLFAGWTNPYILRRMERAIKGWRGQRTRKLTNICGSHPLLVCEARGQGVPSR